MPHISIKLWPGKSEEQKQQLAEAIAKNFREILGSSETSISIGMEEVDSKDWTEKVYKTEILPHMEQLYKKPGYKP